MNNYAVARVFSRIADLMEIKGENAFKIRAYRNAAQTMQELTESLEVLAERGELRSIPGVGDAIADKTRDILTTGTTKLYERLKEEVPESLIELLGLPGFGPKKIQSVWRELGVRNLDELEQAGRQERLRGVGGIGAKSEQKLLEAIEAFRRRSRRCALWTVLPYADGLCRLLRETGLFQRMEIAGSARRMQDTVGDLDLVVSAADPEAALEAASRHAEVREVLAREAGLLRFTSQQKVVVELRATTPERFGWLYWRATGSEAHVAQVEALRESRGVSQELAEEEELFQALGLPFIVPELREGRGEVEAAAAGKLPRLLEQADIRGVLHAHSVWSDGLTSIEKMAHAARELGYAYHGNTDHSRALAMARGLDEERLRAQMAEIDALNAELAGEFRVLKGIECDILADGTLDLPLEALEQLDLVVASVHLHQKQDEETMTARIVRALESGVVDILAHPTGRLLGHRDPYPVDMDRVLDAAVANRVAVEINASYDRLDLNDVYARQAKERGLPISVNTDAHRPENLSQYRYGIAQARRAWLEPEDVINTWELERLLAWLQRRE
ncbi:MAG: DNA polymerase/3'-5' exonuclease PolX [Armatimonadota bacterium]